MAGNAVNIDKLALDFTQTADSRARSSSVSDGRADFSGWTVATGKASASSVAGFPWYAWAGLGFVALAAWQKLRGK